MRVLVVEDNALLRHHLKVQLSELGHQVDAAEDAKEADYYLNEHLPDVAIVDLGLPDEDGLSLIRRWRASEITLPILVLTAREGWQDKVEVLGAGADDYVTKPFRPRELVARVKARLRRRQAAPQASSTLLSAGAIEVDLRTHLATLHGEPLHLTPKEFAILAILAQSVGSPVSAADLFEGAWHERFDDAAANTVMVHIRRLRKKLADIDASTTFIETAWGVGYKLRGAPGDTGHGA